MIGYFYLLLAVVGTSVGQVLLKIHSVQNKRIKYYLLFALLLLVSVPIFIYMSLQYISFMFVFLSDAIAIIVVVVLSSFILKEQISKNKYLGIFFILIGMSVLKWRMI